MKYAVEWLHKRADEMNDPHAKSVLTAAAWNLGNAGKEVIFPRADGQIE